MIITTNVNKKQTENLLEDKAKEIAAYFQCRYIERKRLTIKELIDKYKEIIIVYKNKTVYINEKNEELYFHLDTAMLRIKNKTEPLVELIGEGSKKVLDATMGLARDSIVLSYFGYKVTALEENKIIHYIISDGLKNFSSGNSDVDLAMRRVDTFNIISIDFLKNSNDNAYDVIYLDPMFIYKIKDSNNISIFDSLASQKTLDDKLLNEMKRVAKERIIIKAHKADKIFEEYGFSKIERPGTKFFYGYIDVEN